MLTSFLTKKNYTITTEFFKNNKNKWKIKNKREKNRIKVEKWLNKKKFAWIELKKLFENYNKLKK